MTLRVALIGYGLGGSAFHAPLITSVPGLGLAAVVTGDPERQKAVRARYPQAQALPEAGMIFADPGSYDLVVVSAPNRQHVPLATAALQAGLPVVIDKPVAVTADQARELGGIGPAVFPFHNRRWDGDFRTVQALIGAGELGAIQRFESRFERWRPEVKASWKESADPADAGSILYDLGAHVIDQAVHLFGPPVSVYAEADVRRPGATAADDAFVALTHLGGVRSHLWMSATAADLGPRFRVLGDQASYVVHGLDGQEEALRAGRTPAEPGWGRMPAETFGVLGVPGKTLRVPTEPGAYQDFYAGVVAALLDGAAPPVTLADAVTGLEVIEEALRQAVS
jgi:predicted dehydrogenase